MRQVFESSPTYANERNTFSLFRFAMMCFQIVVAFVNLRTCPQLFGLSHTSLKGWQTDESSAILKLLSHT